MRQQIQAVQVASIIPIDLYFGCLMKKVAALQTIVHVILHDTSPDAYTSCRVQGTLKDANVEPTQQCRPDQQPSEFSDQHFLALTDDDNPKNLLHHKEYMQETCFCNLQGALKAANIIPSDNVVSTNDFLSALTNSFGAEPILFCDEDRSGNKYIDSVR